MSDNTGVLGTPHDFLWERGYTMELDAKEEMDKEVEQNTKHVVYVHEIILIRMKF